jgi:hypothetical protein
MKCPDCGWIVRKVNGAAVAHPCVSGGARRPGDAIKARRRRSDRAQVADRETQHGRYLDAGPAAWDDR